METKNKIIYIVSALIVIFTLFIITDISLGRSTGKGEFTMEFNVEPGQGVNSVATELYENKLIRSKFYFKLWVRFTGNTNKIKQGIYTIDDSMSTRKIIRKLVDGKVKMISFTIPEGYTNRQIGDVLVQKNIIKKRKEFLYAASDREVLEKYKIPAKTAEGYLYPETYTIPYNYKVERIVDMMLKRFYKNLNTIEESKELSPEELHKKVILASIVEREAKKKEEQPLMAGVFLKRLQIKMPFESCATVQYLFDKPKQRLLEKDLLIKSPYNTYLNRGYPPGPISNPGLPAITASFRPVESDSLFFLVKPDGSHYFSKTHEEHLEAKKKYIDVLYE
ncbi:MAG: endolytic transglycosylase MltG [Leptospiraceae bacterium]|nr:endolytic transglycosylase MltG [Leptospiraceae bacterium]